jgi:hypothetical protein
MLCERVGGTFLVSKDAMSWQVREKRMVERNSQKGKCLRLEQEFHLLS